MEVSNQTLLLIIEVSEENSDRIINLFRFNKNHKYKYSFINEEILPK